MEDANGADLADFRRWYRQGRHPAAEATLTHEPATRVARLVLEQIVPPTPGQPDKQPMPLPLRLALFGANSAAPIVPERLHILGADGAEILFEGIDEQPILSINRGFSAPVIVETNRSTADLAFLSAHDDDPFARFEAMQQLMVDTLVDRDRRPSRRIDAAGRSPRCARR